MTVVVEFNPTRIGPVGVGVPAVRASCAWVFPATGTFSCVAVNPELKLKVMSPEYAPGELGANSTAIVQLLPGLSDVEQVPPVPGKVPFR